MRRKAESIPVDVLCCICGNISSLQRTPTHKKTILTKTTNWCYKCKCMTDHYILNDVDVLYNILKNYETLEDDEKEVLCILESNKVKKLIKSNEEK